MTEIEIIKKYVPIEEQEEAITRLNEGYPVQYLVGNVEFYGNLIEVNENVLIPRFETEYLIEKTLNYLKKIKKDDFKILEIGTGSGCISIALKKNLKATIDAIDISKEAIKVATKNAINNKVNINFINEDIHDYICDIKYDLIISNPPYVPIGDDVDEKTKYEPQSAIFAEENGLHFYKVILEKIKNNLSKNYLIAFEIGDKEGTAIKNLALQTLNNCYVKIEKDYNNFERYVFISDNKEIIL